MRALFVAITLLFAALPVSGDASADLKKSRVDALLVLASDVSMSVDDEKFKLQRKGYAEAITNPRFLRAIRSGPTQRIAVAFVEWSYNHEQKVVLDWSVIENPSGARQFADRIMQAPRSFRGHTGIGEAIRFSAVHLARAPFEAERLIIDMSGDGTSNSGLDPGTARDQAVKEGITINGLVILTNPLNSPYPDHTNPAEGLEDYYKKNVIGGPGAFVLVAQDFRSFTQMLTAKMIAEIALAR